MMSGLLTDRFSSERMATMAANDWRQGFPEFAEPALSRNLALRDALAPVAGRHGVSIAATAVAWTLAWPGVTGAIVGGRSPDRSTGGSTAGAWSSPGTTSRRSRAPSTRPARARGRRVQV